jgi:hypothetical protein
MYSSNEVWRNRQSLLYYFPAGIGHPIAAVLSDQPFRPTTLAPEPGCTRGIRHLGCVVPLIPSENFYESEKKSLGWESRPPAPWQTPSILTSVDHTERYIQTHDLARSNLTEWMAKNLYYTH